MARSDGSVIIDTRMDTKGFGKGVNTMQKQIGGLSGAIGKLGLAIAATFAVGKLIQFGKEAIELGSDLQEVQNVVDVTFSTMNEAVNEFARNASETAGLSETMAKRYTGTFGAMAKAFGFAEEQSFQMSTALTQLAGDVASFYNLTQDEAYTKLKSVFTGETETLKDLGVVMTQSALDAFAMAEGYGKTTKAMSEQEKVALRFAFVTKQLNAASGDFIRTQDSWANQTRILSLNFDSFKANIGQALINIFTPFLKVINQIVAKMAELSSSFVTFSEMIFGKSISGGGGSPPAEVLGDITEGYEDVESAATGAKKAQDKYLSGLDEIRTFTESTDSGAAAVGGGIDLSKVAESKGEVEETETAVSALVERMKELANLFKEGFAEGLGDTEYRLQSLKDSVASIKDSFEYIFDENLVTGFNATLDQVSFSLGEIGGAFSSVGLTLAANLLGGFSGFLEDEKPNIQSYLLSMFDIQGQIIETSGELSSAFAYIFEVFAGENGQQVTEDIFGIFFTAFSNVSLLAAAFSNDIYSFLATPFINSKEEIKTALEDLLSGISDFTGSVRTTLDEFFELINQFYTEHISPIFENLIPDMENLWKEHLAPLVSKFGEFFSNLGENITYVWEEVLKPWMQWFSDNIGPVITPILENVGRNFINFFGTIADVIGNILDILGGLIDFVVGVFTRDWEKAWGGIVNVFKGIVNTLASLIEGFVNSAINTINGLIGGVNAITSNIGIPAIPTIPEFNIPRLATGAVIPPNAPFMAVLGDQRRGTNIEAPLDTIKQAVREVVGNNNGSGGQYRFSAQINRRVLFEEFIEEAKLQMSMTGHNPLDLRM